jgi:hypothetical protein
VWCSVVWCGVVQSSVCKYSNDEQHEKFFSHFNIQNNLNWSRSCRQKRERVKDREERMKILQYKNDKISMKI